MKSELAQAARWRTGGPRALRSPHSERHRMAHEHGNEYQVKIVHTNGTEQLSGWMKSEEQIPQVMASVHMSPGKTYWLQRRNVVCPNCLDREQRILELPVTHVLSLRWQPHDSRHMRW